MFIHAPVKFNSMSQQINGQAKLNSSQFHLVIFVQGIFFLLSTNSQLDLKADRG